MACTGRPLASTTRIALLAGFLSLAAGTAAPLAAQVVPASRATASALYVDGELTESIWSRAEPIDEFLQREPSEGAPPTFRTEARVAYDDSAIYVAVRAFDPQPDRITAFLTRRDVWSASDWIRVYLDSYHDRRSAYSFAVNPLGVKLDTYHFNDTNEDDTWDAVWEVAVSRDAEGWRAEFRIPFSQLRFSAGGDGRLGFAVARSVARLNETTTWPLLSKGAVGMGLLVRRPRGSRQNGRAQAPRARALHRRAASDDASSGGQSPSADAGGRSPRSAPTSSTP